MFYLTFSLPFDFQEISNAFQYLLTTVSCSPGLPLSVFKYIFKHTQKELGM